MGRVALLIDGNNLAWRAKYAYDLSYQGQSVGVTYGVVRMLQSLITNYKPHSVVLCWDGGTPDFRKALVPSYKANRGKDRDELEYLDFMCQLQELWRILSQFGILQIKRKGIEADDLLYHASRLLDGDAIIVTADEDLLQAVTDQVSVFKPGKKEQLITPDTMEIPVEDFVEYKTLQGDSSDNIPGVNGVGPKTAQKIINGEPISDRLAAKVESYIAGGGYDEAYLCMDLSVDRAGARRVILEAEYIRFSAKACKIWLIEYGFTSILEGKPLGMTFGRLRKPIFSSEGYAIPRVWSFHRSPVE